MDCVTSPPPCFMQKQGEGDLTHAYHYHLLRYIALRLPWM